MKKILNTLILLLILPLSLAAKDYSVASPSGALKMFVSVEGTTTYTLVVNGQTVLENCRIAMELADGTTLGNGEVRKDTRGSRVESISALNYRQKDFTAVYNYLSLRYEGDYTLQVRAYDDGVAYRFVTSFPDDITVKSETVQFNFSDRYQMFIPFIPASDDKYRSSFESQYTVTHTIGDARSEQYAFLPILVKDPDFGSLLLMESDVEDYPGMFISQTKAGLKGEFSPVPDTFREPSKHGATYADTYKDYIASTSGSRTFPWRIIGYAAKDTDLPLNNMVCQTASPSRIDDTSWIEAGLSSWDWWNAFRLHGVDFKSGINNATYKYHIDFAAQYGLKYVVLDEGWYQPLTPLETIPEIDIAELCSYASGKGVKLILWISADLLYKELEQICEKYSSLGVAGFKVDFFDHQNQRTVKQVYDIADVAQRYRLVLDLHGIYKPTGITRTYPNILNMEGVYGLENSKWANADKNDMPTYDVTVPYIRMVCGPMDYTPGAMRNASRRDFKPIYDRPMSQGTRAHQMAMYIVYDSPLTMLCDSPSDYLAEPQTASFIASIPTVFETTETVAGEVGSYIVTKRSAEGRYYYGGLTNWNARDVEIDLSFLGEGEWQATIYRDGVNADTVASDHILETIDLGRKQSLSLHLAPGGGFAIIIESK